MEITKEFFPASSFKTTRDEGIREFSKIRSYFEMMGISLIVLRGAKYTIIKAFSLVTMLSSGFSWNYLQNKVANTTKQSTKFGNKLDYKLEPKHKL